MENSGISAKQKAAIRALMAGSNCTEAAKAAHVHENTVYQWFKEPAFVEALKLAEGEAMQAVTRQLVTLAGEAVDTLRDIMKDGEENASPRVRAADALLNRVVQFKELSEFEQRLTALEAAQNEQQP